MERYAGFRRNSLELVSQVQGVVDSFLALQRDGVFHRVAADAAAGVPVDDAKLTNVALFGKLILEMGSQARMAALQRILSHLRKTEFEEALFTLRLVSLGSGGAFSNVERKQLTELIESMMPPDIKARLDAQSDALEGDGEEDEDIDERIGKMPVKKEARF